MVSSVAEREAFRKVVQNFICKNQHLSKANIVKHFVHLGHPRSTMYSVVNKLTETSSTTEKKRTGRPSTWTPNKRRRLKRLCNNRFDTSQRKLAAKFDVSVQTICNQLRKMNITYRKREKTPKYTKKSAKKSRNLSRKLHKKLRVKKQVIIMDDEKYFTFSSTHNSGYYTIDKNSCPESVRFLGHEKFPGKVLMWIAISERGMSQPYFAPSKSFSVNKNVYINECLEKRLLPFIRNKHRGVDYIFWPDLARAHTAKDTVEWMKRNIKFVPIEVNPPNVPQARPIENFWGCLSQKVYEGGWTAATSDQLIARINDKLKLFDKTFLQTLMSGIEKKLDTISRKGVFGPYKN